MRENRIWVGTSEGLVSLTPGSSRKNQDNPWKEEYRFQNISQEIRTIVEDKKGNLWLGTLTKGVLAVDFTGGGQRVHPGVTAKNYHTGHGLPPGEVHVFMAAGHVMFATGKGVYRFNEQTRRFLPDDTLGNEFAGGKRNVFRIAEAKDKTIWFHSGLRNFQAVPQPGSYVIHSIPFLRIPLGQVNTIYPDPVADGAVVWLARNDDLTRFDTRIKKNYRHDFPTLIRQVLVNGKPVFAGYKNNGSKWKPGTGETHAVVAYKDRNLRFRYAAPFFEAETETRYRRFLEGYDPGWSDWTGETQKDYTNLDSGFYTFRVQAKNVYRHPGREDVFQFRVLPPWYETWWAFLFYAFAAFLFVYLIVRWRSGKLVKEKQKLEQTVRERTKEINHKNQQLEKQTGQLKDQSGKLQEMAKVKSRFFANISHEFRTPLTLIIGPLEQIISDYRETDGKLVKKVNLMLRNSQRLLMLINQLLDLSKFDSGKMRLKAARQNIIPFLEGILAAFQLLAQQQKLDLKFHAEEENITLYFDAEKMEAAVGNLLLNAVKFTPAGGEIAIKVSSPEAGFLEMSVCDTGKGIPKDRLLHIFDRFFQVEKAGADLGEYDHKGSGIGLALAKELVSLHHGKIDVHSREGKDSGTEFIIRLPMGNGHLKPGEIVDFSEVPPDSRESLKVPAAYMMKREGDKPAAGEKEPGPGPEPGAAAREKNVILVVEDNSEVRKYIREPLEPFYTVAEAADGAEGIKKAREIIPDLIISDIMMPGQDGYELCKILKNDIKTSHVPIILLTAKASEECVVRGLETGADDYITKPFNTKMLTARIKNLIDLRRQLQLKIQRQKMLLPDEIAVSSLDEAFLKEFQVIVEKNLSDPEFGIDWLCKELYMGRTTLFTKIEALTGESPKQFIQSYRLERAAHLLKSNFGNVTEVAFEVGFSSSAYFTKCFKEKFHQLPSTFQASEVG